MRDFLKKIAKPKVGFIICLVQVALMFLYGLISMIDDIRNGLGYIPGFFEVLVFVAFYLGLGFAIKKEDKFASLGLFTALIGYYFFYALSNGIYEFAFSSMAFKYEMPVYGITSIVEGFALIGLFIGCATFLFAKYVTSKDSLKETLTLIGMFGLVISTIMFVVSTLLIVISSIADDGLMTITWYLFFDYLAQALVPVIILVLAPLTGTVKPSIPTSEKIEENTETAGSTDAE